MSKIEEQSSGKKEGEIRYLTHLILILIRRKSIVDLSAPV